MLPLPVEQAAAIGAGLLGLSQRAADLRRHAAACPAEHTALDLTSLIERLSAAGLAESSPAAPAVATGQGGSPTRF